MASMHRADRTARATDRCDARPRAAPPPGRAGSRGPRERTGRSPRAAALAPYLLLLPALAATVVLLGWPLVKNGMLSFQNLNMRS